MQTESEVFTRAADLIEERGWSPRSPHATHDGCLCIEAAIAVAVGLDPTAWALLHEDAWALLHEDWPDSDAYKLGHRCVLFLEERKLGGRAPWSWNDDTLPGGLRPRRTQEEVVTLLREAAVDAASS